MTDSFYLVSPALSTRGPAQEGLVNRLHVRKYGSGPAILLAVHGFGRSGQRMERLGLHLGQYFTTLAPDLPYHGDSEWYADRYSIAEITELLQQLVDRFPARPIYLLGHSLGGRFLMSCLAGLRHDGLRDLVLVAPDGAGGRYTHWIDNLPPMLVKPLARLTERPRGILRVSKFLRRRGLINRYSAEYLDYNLKNRSFRRRLAGTLRSVLQFPPAPADFEAALQRNGINCTVFVGDKDPLLHHQRLNKLYEPLPSVAVRDYPGSHWLPERLLAQYYLNFTFAG